MGIKRFNKYYLYGIFAFTTLSCEYYLGINQQPQFRGQNIEEGMNVFGLLRPDSIESYNKSFVYVQQIWPVLEIGGYKIISDVTVWVEHIINNEVTETIEFPFVPSDSFFNDTLYRPLTNFTPRPGERYRLICQYGEFPDAVGETVVPPEPRIKENSLAVAGRNVSFTLVADSLIGMIDIYLITDNYNQILDRIVPSMLSDTEIELTLPVDPQELILRLFAYDQNLAVYNGNSNISLNFNKYRTTISTLESGFGVFGSLNYTDVELQVVN